MKLNLDQLETKLQKLVEDQLAGILPGLKLEDRVIQRLATAVKENIVHQKDDGGAVGPNVFTLIVATDTSPMWKEQRTMEALKNIIVTACRDVGIALTAQPTIAISTDDSFSAEEVKVIASHRLEPMAETKGMQTSLSNEESGEGSNIPENAFLIIEGVKVHQLTESVVNIGRRLENHLVIDDPRVSRNHAQLRAIKGRFVLFDLNSTGGTFVNGQRTSQTVLYPGDVISLAGVALIFGQDNPPPQSALGNTGPLESEPGASERPTAAVEQNTVDIRTGSLKDKKDEENLRK